jgi:hypothetical protein
MRSDPMANEKSGSGERNEIGSLTLNIKPEALQKIVADGRLLELTSRLATEAAAQISAQVVDHVARAAVSKQGLEGASASFSYVFDGGDFGTVPHRPHFGVVQIGGEFATETALTRVVAQAVRTQT